MPSLHLSSEICVVKSHNIFYTDGSLVQDKAGYGVFSPTIPLSLSQRLPGTQTILRAELMAISVAIQNIPQHWKYSQVCTDSRTSLLLLSKYLRHPSRILDHPDIDLIKQIIINIQKASNHIHLAKVRAHIGISGNEKDDALAKFGSLLPTIIDNPNTKDPTTYQIIANGQIMCNIPELTKSLVRQDFFMKALDCKQLKKWLQDPSMNPKLSNKFWTLPSIKDSEITITLKMRFGQYMGNARKHLFGLQDTHLPLAPFVI